MTENNRQYCRAIALITIFFAFSVFSSGLTKRAFARGEVSNVPKLSNNLPVVKDLKMLNFSLTKHSRERSLVRKRLRIAAKDKDASIYIALADLDDDGINEIFSYVESTYFCGTLGCPLDIYSLKNNILKSLLDFDEGFPLVLDIDKTGKQSVIGVLPSKTLGFHDVYIVNRTVWKWNGKRY